MNKASLLSEDINLSYRLELGNCKHRSFPDRLSIKILAFSEFTKVVTVDYTTQKIKNIIIIMNYY